MREAPQGPVLQHERRSDVLALRKHIMTRMNGG